ncbi:MAG: zinc ribbon domain-containing protein [Candidatus Bathyarchaeota archaeon]|nr:zinc ribbon domain-containing protein [Candidatus Bathyarchaeota archaeon]
MVHCIKCGNENPDDAKYCAKCGARLYATGESRHFRRMEDECFGLPQGKRIFAIIFGIIIIFWGLSMILGDIYDLDIPWWAFIAILFGVMIILRALFGRKYRY